MPEQGYIEVFAYTGVAQLPLENVAIIVTDSNNAALAMRLTNRNGFSGPIEIPTPNLTAGQKPDTGVTPFKSVNLFARLEGYEHVESIDIQLFPGVTTRFNLEMIPLSEFPSSWDKTVRYQTPAQNL